MPDLTINLQRLNLGGFLRLMLAQFLLTPAFRMIFILPCVFGVLLALFSLVASDAGLLTALWMGLSIPLMAVASLGTFVLAGSLLCWLFLGRRYRRTVYTFTHWGMESSNGAKKTEKPWRAFVKAGETRHYFLLFVTAKVPLLLRKQDFDDPGAIEAFRELLLEKELLPAEARWGNA